MISKLTLIFEQGPYGWTESIWLQASATSLQTHYGIAEGLAITRSGMLGEDSRIKGIRVSDEASLNDSLLNNVNLPGRSGEGSAMQNVSLNCNCWDANFKRHKRIFLRGIWDSVEVNGGKFQAGLESFKTLFNNWRRKLINTEFGWMGSNPLLKKQSAITNYTSADTGEVIFTLGAPLFVVGDVGKVKQVRIAKLNGRSNLNGQMIVRVNSTTVCATVDRVAALPFATQGTMSLNEKEFIPIVEVVTERIGSRKAGAPLLTSVGRAKKRVRG